MAFKGSVAAIIIESKAKGAEVATLVVSAITGRHHFVHGYNVFVLSIDFALAEIIKLGGEAEGIAQLASPPENGVEAIAEAVVTVVVSHAQGAASLSSPGIVVGLAK